MPPPTFPELKAFVEKARVKVTTHLRSANDPLGDYKPPEEISSGARTIQLPGRIRIYSSDGQQGQPQVITLAHEYGHHQRWKNGERESGYKAMIDLVWMHWAAQPETERRKVHTEEAVAWAYAEKTLRDFSFEDWAAFVTDRDLGLADYRKKLVLSLPLP